MWVPRSAPARLKYLGIVEALDADIRAGRVMPGDRLPPQRAVAEALGVDLTTVTRAFNEARRRGLISAQAGRGTFVSEEMASEGRLIDLSMNVPPQPESIDFRKLIPQDLAALLNAPRGLMALQYQDSTGTPPSRQAAARWLETRTGPIPADRVLVTAGAQGALSALCATLLRAGQSIATGALTYPGLKAIAAQQGLNLVPLDMDADGLLPESFDRACRSHTIRALYVTPSIDNPTTATLPADRRRALVALARQHQVTIFEDDPYAPLRPTRLPSLIELAPERCWHIASLSKCVTPTLRVAHVVAPNPTEALRLAATLRATVLMAPPLMAALTGRWIVDGRLEQIALAVRAENVARQRLARRVLSGCDFAADPHGHHLWLHLPHHWRAADFADHAVRAGVSVVSSAAFATGAQPVHAVRVSLGVALDRSDLEDGLDQLAQLIGQPAIGAGMVV
ncbi:PLP-dependent aminotransferase family protein [Paracoccus sp. M683]|uniref:aminotransferase-like domain-containing protein n=1 Tax=Paracoccus sp. M683 TaxID=2594268 RepID=UPI001180A223|nr:PLP-dependent aminotransferase family protein [Paracoccus sp. M683]TRW99387.1 PLP-dependent aminotransferase family protein [Paracoccus sp. M683]